MDASKAYVDSFFGGCDKVSLLEGVKIQAQVLVPVIRALRKELGTDRLAGGWMVSVGGSMGGIPMRAQNGGLHV